MTAYAVSLLRRAQADLDNIFDWIAERSPKGATQWYSAFLRATATLRRNPARCAQAPESAEVNSDIRQLLFRTRRGRNYRLLFAIVENYLQLSRTRFEFFASAAQVKARCRQPTSSIGWVPNGGQ
jgi:plasmid stabilization system protein ParE